LNDSIARSYPPDNATKVAAMAQRPASSATLFNFRRYGDLVLAFGVMAIMALLVLRLPAPVIDVLVAINIGCGVALLLIALYLRHPVAFNSFPGVLLISTLFRLSLSVATTRLILLDAHAGHIIDAFGHFVAGGNLVVGVVVFIIITIVQFIVIAKGAERVAEVAARFTLDAMPGKQLSIDSDLRSGLIDKDEAKRRRSFLERESQLNGALDGAMKFVKGDAIASIIIVIVNLLGGLTIGVLQRGLPAGEAMAVYSILTIGDGMVAQIPALLSAMAAGLVVTRSAGDDRDGHLGESIGRQVTAQPRALMMTGFIALLLAMVPGFPAAVFVGIAAVAFLLARYSFSNARKASADTSGAPIGSHTSLDGAADEMRAESSSLAQPLAVEVCAPESKQIDIAAVRAAIAATVSASAAAFGIRLPDPGLVLVTHANSPAWRVLIFDVPIAVASPGAGFDVDLLQRELAAVLARNAERFVGVQEVTNLLEAAAAQYPALVKEVTRQLPTQKIAEVLRHLLREDVPVRNLRDVLEALAEWSGREKEAAGLAEFVRVHLKSYMTNRFADAELRLRALVLDGAAEDLIRRALKETPAGVMLMLPPEKIAELRGSLRAELDRLQKAVPASASREQEVAAERAPTLITSIDVRRHVRSMLAAVCPTLAVISYQELLPDVQLQPLGAVRFQTETS
jgi:type III secretion protein V